MSSTKSRVLYTFMLHVFLVSFVGAANPGDTLSYAFANENLPRALHALSNQYQIPILYVNNQTDSIKISAHCHQCSQEKALTNLLTGTSLRWKSVNHQYIIYDSKSEDILSKPEIAQNKKFSIEGYIYDSISNEPLPFAAISIKGTGKGTITNPEGFFSINNLPANVYELNILYVGYQTDSLIADLRRHENISIKQIKLNPKRIELDAIIIRKAAIHKSATVNKASMVLFNPLRLKTTPTMDQGDIVQNIRLAPGVNIIPDDPMGINLRGGASDQTLILFDRIPIYHTQHLMGFNGLLNANCAENISLHSGGFPARFGDRLSGVLDVEGRKGVNEGISAGLSANLYTLRGYLNLPLTKNSNLYVTFNKSTDWFGLSRNLLVRYDYSYFNLYDQVQYTGKFGTGFYTHDLAGYEYEVSLSDFNDITTKLTYALSPKDTLRFTLLSSKDQIDVSSEPDSVDWNKAGRSEYWNTLGCNSSYTRKWTSQIQSDLGLTLSSFENNTRFRYFDSDQVLTDFNNINKVIEAEVFLNVAYQMHKNLSWVGGLEYSGIETGLERFDQTDTVMISAYSNHQNVRKVTAFSELRLNAWRNVDVNLGLRSNKIYHLEGVDVEPRVSVRSKLGRYFSASLAWGIYHQYIHRTPSVVSYNLSSIGPTGSWIYSQQNLHPSKAMHWLAGLNFDTPWYSVHASAYYKKYSQLHLIIPSQMKIAYIDNTDREKRSLYIDWIKNREVLMSGSDEIDIFSGAGSSTGLEVILSKNKGVYTGFISYHLSNSEFLFPYMNEGKPFTPSYDHTHELKTMNYLSYFNWNVGSIIYLVSGKPYPNQYPYRNYFDANELSLEHPINWEMNSHKRLPAYANMDLSVSYDIKTKGKIMATVGMVMQNVLNTKNVISKYYTWSKVEQGDEPVLELRDQYSHGRLFNVFLSIDLN